MFEWDPEKAQQNLKKHGIAFPDTFGVFDDPHSLTVEDETYADQRFVTIGIDGFGRLLVVAYTWRGETIRIISARKATRTETRDYESQL